MAKRQTGTREGWKNGMMGKQYLLISPVFHHSNLPPFPLLFFYLLNHVTSGVFTVEADHWQYPVSWTFFCTTYIS